LEIIINLSTGLKYTPEKFRTLNTFKKAYSYNTRSTDEKQVLLDYWNTLSIKGTLAQKTRAKALVANLWIGLQDTPEIFDTRESYNIAYGYTTKNPQLQWILDKFWRMIDVILT
jgi:hypothetical protein